MEKAKVFDLGNQSEFVRLKNKTPLKTVQFLAKEIHFFEENSEGHTVVLVGENLSAVSELETIFKKINTESKEVLKKELRAKGVHSIGLLDAECLQYWDDSLPIIQDKIEFTQSHFVFLVPYSFEAYSSYEAEVVESFLASVDFFIDFFDPKIETALCYDLSLKAISGESQVAQILVNQPGHPNPFIAPKVTEKMPTAEMVIPHKGELSLLKNALFSIKKQKQPINQVTVCLDEAVTDEHYEIAEAYKEFRFFSNHPTGVGPYPPRDVVARNTDKAVIFFQDSDDISTVDRASAQLSALNNKEMDVVGSHEIRINKLTQQVEAFRYPLKVNEALDHEVVHALFFPTTAIKKEAYLKAGGLSTIRRHSSDTQFWFRSYFYLNMRNIDEFLYVRVKREGSLTTAPGTSLNSPVRERTKHRWCRDFANVSSQKLPLLESSLLDEYRDEDFSLIPLEKENRELFLNWHKLTQQLQEKATLKVEQKPNFPSNADILEGRISFKKSFGVIDEHSVLHFKNSLSWKIGWAITRVIVLLFGWIPFIKKRIK